MNTSTLEQALYFSEIIRNIFPEWYSTEFIYGTVIYNFIYRNNNEEDSFIQIISSNLTVILITVFKTKQKRIWEIKCSKDNIVPYLKKAKEVFINEKL